MSRIWVFCFVIIFGTSTSIVQAYNKHNTSSLNTQTAIVASAVSETAKKDKLRDIKVAKRKNKGGKKVLKKIGAGGKKVVKSIGTGVKKVGKGGKKVIKKIGAGVKSIGRKRKKKK